VRNRVGDLLNARGRRRPAHLDKAIGNALVDGGERHAGHGARRLFRPDDLEEGRQQRARVDLAEVALLIE